MQLHDALKPRLIFVLRTASENSFFSRINKLDAVVAFSVFGFVGLHLVDFAVDNWEQISRRLERVGEIQKPNITQDAKAGLPFLSVE